MNRLFINMLIYLLIVCYYADSQNISLVNKDMDVWELLGIDSEETDEYEELYDELSYLMDHPLEINQATVIEFQKLPFLSDEQIEEIINYRKKYGNLVSVYELKNMETLDFSIIRLLLYFVYIDEKSVDNYPVSVDNLFKYGRNELVIRYDRSFQQKKGYQAIPDSILLENPNKKYLGEPFYHSLRYIYTYDTRIQAGLITEKDAGEPFFNKYHKGYDYYSAHLVLKDINRFKTVVIGDYKASFGQGLVFSQSYTPGHTAMVTQAERKNHGFRRHFSTNEYDYLRGVAATFALVPLDISIFYSYRRLDGIMDSCYIRSIKKDGLHRIERDRERKHLFSLSTIGGNIRYANHTAAIGITAVNTSFGNNIFYPEEKPYNLYYFRGKSTMNIGVDYMWKKKALKIFGEVAWAKNGGMAHLHAVQIAPASYINVLTLYRYYDKQYDSFYGKAFARQSLVRNEEGFYTAIRFSPFPYWKFSGYVDIFRFPWLRYGVDAPSNGKEYMIQIDRTLRMNISFYIRYRYRKNEKNSTIDSSVRMIQPYSQRKIQFQGKLDTDQWLLKTGIEYGYYSFESIYHKGFILSQSAGWKPLDLPFRIDLYGSWFQTDDYAVRFSSYEKNLLYAFYSPTVYGKGFRMAVVIQWEIIKRLTFTCKIAQTKYSHRDKIGTGLEEIEGNKKGDMYLQMRWKF